MSIIGSQLLVAALLAAALPACSSPEHKSQGDYYARFVTPEDNAVLSGLADVKLEISVPEEAVLFELGVEGESMSALKGVTGDLKLNTTTIANGRKTLKAQLTGESGAQWSDTINVQISNAAHQLVSYQLNADAYAKGEEINLPPAAFIPIRAVTGSGSGRKVLAESATKANGTFDFYLPDSAPAEYQLEAEAGWTPVRATAPMVQVNGLWDTSVYLYTIAANANDQASAAGQTVRIDIADNGGAFNILDILQKGLIWAYGHFSAGDANKVVPVRAKWARDKGL